ncbi:winged helix-turn-helix transcriptional regulator [Phytohabitans houttuyneae]|uniref:Transcriptional regulator n=1 Tax=Phytohabitans houttuyneae TaxID=1076126 RepID=A0A6V8KCN3_9ACTN|nr:transcriptional regulator [Phytohabitans houttuyneae]
MARRTYDQQCALAYALDVIGERWTLLIIRELLSGPQRYSAMLDALPGIGSNLLAERLAFLVDRGLVVQSEPGRRTSGYELTELGGSLRPAVLDLARFGLTYAARERPAPGSVVTGAWAKLAIEAMVDERRAADLAETYQFEVDDEVFHVAVDFGRVRTLAGPATDPTLTVRTDATSFFKLGLRQLDPVEALVTGAVQATGSGPAVMRCLWLIGLAKDPPAGLATPERESRAGTHS